MRAFVFLLLCFLCLSACKKNLSLQQNEARKRQALSLPPEAVNQSTQANLVQINLRAARITNAEAGAYQYAYNGTVPGPTIRAQLGDTLEVIFENQLQMGTTIHWHGLELPFDMDGVTWMGAPIAAGASFTYRFTLNRAGTFWYHPHFNTEHQVDGGLFGMLVVEDPREPSVDEELVLVFDAVAEEGAPSDKHGHGRSITQWRVNGEAAAQFDARGGTVVRARMVNASNFAFLALKWPSIRQIGSDQGLLPSLQRPARIVLAPGDRADVLLYIGESDFDLSTDAYSLNGGDALGDPIMVLEIKVNKPTPVTATISFPFSSSQPSPDPGYADIVYAFAGSDRSGTWFINGEQYPNVTIETIPLGSSRVLEIRNLSPTEHPFHLHGLRFEVLSIDDVPPPYQMIEDTINIKIRQRVRLLVHADNPGDWMAHCHILPHAGDGMMTVLRVE